MGIEKLIENQNEGRYIWNNLSHPLYSGLIPRLTHG